MKKLHISLNIVLISLKCSFLSAITLAITSLFIFHGINLFYPMSMFIGVLVYTFIYFLAYLIFATPVQIVFCQKPKLFNAIYLLIYLIVSTVATGIVIIISVGKNSDVIYFSTIIILSSIFFWIFDSIFLQRKFNILFKRKLI